MASAVSMYEKRICVRVDIAFLLGEDRDFGDLGKLSYSELRALRERLLDEERGGPRVESLEDEEVLEAAMEAEFASVAPVGGEK